MTKDRWSELLAALRERSDWTASERGWPWPWENSGTTDYAYVYVRDEMRIEGYCFGRPCDLSRKESDDDFCPDGHKEASLPDMTARQAVTFGPRSGLIVISDGKVTSDVEDQP